MRGRLLVEPEGFGFKFNGVLRAGGSRATLISFGYHGSETIDFRHWGMVEQWLRLLEGRLT